jgi:hypothetical protein
VLDLQTDRELLELLKAKLRRREHEALELAEFAASVGLPELSDQAEQLAKAISDIIVIPEVMRGRIAFSGPTSANQMEKSDVRETKSEASSKAYRSRIEEPHASRRDANPGQGACTGKA